MVVNSLLYIAYLKGLEVGHIYVKIVGECCVNVVLDIQSKPRPARMPLTYNSTTDIVPDIMSMLSENVVATWSFRTLSEGWLNRDGVQMGNMFRAGRREKFFLTQKTGSSPVQNLIKSDIRNGHNCGERDGNVVGTWWKRCVNVVIVNRCQYVA